jgi:Tol biopolymer transport system component
MEDDGTGRRLLTAAPPRFVGIQGYIAVDFQPRWSSDGSRIAFWRSGAERREDDGLYVMNADGSEPRALLQPPPRWDFDWSPADDLLAFAAVREDGAGAPDVPSDNPLGIRDHDVFVMGSDGSGLRRVVASPIEDTDPSFSADGARLEFRRYRYGGFNEFYGGFASPDEGWYSVALDGSDERRLTVGFPQRVEYSPDGAWAAYNDGRVWVMRADGSDPRDVTPSGMFGWGGELVWGSNGPSLFFTAMRTDWEQSGAGAQLFRVEPGRPDESAVPITPPGGFPNGVDWTPGPDDPNPRFVDESPPAALFLGGSGPSASAVSPVAHASTVLQRRSLRLLATDATGIRTVRLAVARRVRRGGRVLCRYASANGLGAPRSCARPRFIRGSTEEKLISPLRRLRPGRYLAGFATADVRGNRTKKLHLSPVRLR